MKKYEQLSYDCVFIAKGEVIAVYNTEEQEVRFKFSGAVHSIDMQTAEELACWIEMLLDEESDPTPPLDR